MTFDKTCVYLFCEGDTPLRFPVNPSSLHIYGGSHTLNNRIISFGDIAEISNEKLKTIRFSVHILQLYSRICSCNENDFVSSATWLNALSTWLYTKSPLRFVYCSPEKEINLPVAISEYEISEHGGYPNDIFLTLSLSELRDSTAEGHRAFRDTPSQYTASSNDDLFSVARSVYGTDSWQDVYLANGHIINNSVFIPEGTVLAIP